MYEFRLATINDLKGILKCINDAKVFLKKSGSTQWNEPDGYPNEESIINDINSNFGYVIVKDNIIASYCAIALYEKAYDKIYDGNFTLSDKKYLTIHRVCVNDDFRGEGFGYQILKQMETVSVKLNLNYIRIDTHKLNKVMQGLLSKLSYNYCGYVLYESKDDPVRLAYDKIIK